MEKTILSNEQCEELAKKLMHFVEKRYRIIPINFLPDLKYFLKNPIYISVEITDSEVVASFDDIEAFAVAETEYEAIERLCEEIIQVYEDLVADRDNLGVLPQKWLQHLENVIVCR